MRFALAVLAAAIVQVFPYFRLDRWIGIGGLLAVAYLELAALGAGFFARSRPWLAGALSVLLGALLYVIVATATPSGGEGPGLGGFLFFLLRIPIAIFPFILLGAVAGAAGGWLRRRALGGSG